MIWSIKNLLTRIDSFFCQLDDYLEYEDDTDRLPEFPLKKPSAFQIFESDCKLNPMLISQLKMKFIELSAASVDEFISRNLANILTDVAASVYSWNGQQGNIAIMKFRTIKVLIGL